MAGVGGEVFDEVEKLHFGFIEVARVCRVAQRMQDGQLGSFIEFEGVATAERDANAFEPLVTDLRRQFGIADADLLAASYSDLVEATTI